MAPAGGLIGRGDRVLHRNARRRAFSSICALQPYVLNRNVGTVHKAERAARQKRRVPCGALGARICPVRGRVEIRYLYALAAGGRPFIMRFQQLGKRNESAMGVRQP